MPTSYRHQRYFQEITERVREVSCNSSIKEVTVKNVVRSLIVQIEKELEMYGYFKLGELGTFKVTEVKGSTRMVGGTMMYVQPYDMITFVPSFALKNIINKRQESKTKERIKRTMAVKKTKAQIRKKEEKKQREKTETQIRRERALIARREFLKNNKKQEND